MILYNQGQSRGRTRGSLAGYGAGVPYPVGSDPQNADAVPDYDDWGVDDYWNCPDWVQWHGALKAKYGKQKADFTWVSAWAKQSTGASPIDCRSFNDNFKSWAKSEGLFDALYTDTPSFIKIIGAGAGIASKGADVVESATDAAKTAATTSLNIAAYAIPLALVALAFIYFQRAKKVV